MPSFNLIRHFLEYGINNWYTMYLLTELGRAGRENIWFEVMAYGPSGSYDYHSASIFFSVFLLFSFLSWLRLSLRAHFPRANEIIPFI